MENQFSLLKKRVLVTGATGHLGKAISFALGRAGAHVLVNSREKSKADEFIKVLHANNISAEEAVFDFNKNSEIFRCFESIGSKSLAAIVNNGFGGNQAGSIDLLSDEDYRACYQDSVISVQNIFKTFMPSLKLAVSEFGYASVINIASMYGICSPYPNIYDDSHSVNSASYGVSKAALLQWTKYAACQFGDRGIRVNAISPGPFPRSEVLEKNPAFESQLISKVPMGRLGAASEIGGPVVFLASNASSYVNGTNLIVDGGWTAW